MAKRRGGRERGLAGPGPHPGPGGRTGWTRSPCPPQPRRSNQITQIFIAIFFFHLKGWGYAIPVREENREEYQYMQYSCRCPILRAWVLERNQFFFINFINLLELKRLFKTINFFFFK
jgi:hypothetical protein